MSLSCLQQLVSHPAQVGQVPLFCCLGAWCLCVQTFALFLCNHSWAWATNSQLTWKTVNLVCKYDMWLMRVDNPTGKKVPVCLVSILGISRCIHSQPATGSLTSGIHNWREIQWICWKGSAGGQRAGKHIIWKLITFSFRAMGRVAQRVVHEVYGVGKRPEHVCTHSVIYPCSVTTVQQSCRSCSANFQLAQQKWQPKQIHLVFLCFCPISKDSDKLKQFSSSYVIVSKNLQSPGCFFCLHLL